MHRLHSFLRLAPADRHLLIETALLLAAIRLGLSLLSFRTVLGLLATTSKRDQAMDHERKLKTRNLELETFRSRSARRAPSDRIAWAVDLASKYIPTTKNCLIRALATHALLTKQRRTARLHIGVAKSTDNKLQAHAWVESDEKVVIGGSELERFTPLVSVPVSRHSHKLLLVKNLSLRWDKNVRKNCSAQYCSAGFQPAFDENSEPGLPARGRRYNFFSRAKRSGGVPSPLPSDCQRLQRVSAAESVRTCETELKVL